MKEIQKNINDILKLTTKCNIHIGKDKNIYTSIEIFKIKKNIKENIVEEVKNNFFTLISFASIDFDSK